MAPSGREEEGGFAEDVAVLLGLVEEVDVAVAGLGVVEAEGAVAWRTASSGGEVRPGVEVVGDVAELPFLAVVLLVADLSEAECGEEFGGGGEVVDLDLGGAVDAGGVGDLLEGEGGLAAFVAEAQPLFALDGVVLEDEAGEQGAIEDRLCACSTDRLRIMSGSMLRNFASYSCWAMRSVTPWGWGESGGRGPRCGA
jgi:hypothetical protein